MTASSEAAINDFDTSVSRIVVVLPPLKNTNTSLVYVFVCDRVCKLLVRLNLNNRKLLRVEKRRFSGCYRPVGVSYVGSTPVVQGGILIIGNFIFATHKLLKYSIFVREKFICGRFALHNS